MPYLPIAPHLPTASVAPWTRGALLVFASPLALDLRRRRFGRQMAPLLRGPSSVAAAAASQGFDVHIFSDGPRLRNEGGNTHWHAQLGRTFGEKFEQAIADLAGQGYSHVVVVGRDCPELGSEDVSAAFAALHEGRRLVLGPDQAGGCYLIGLATAQRYLLAGVPWCCGRDFAALSARVGETECSVLPTKHDLDSVADLRAFALTRGSLSALAFRLLGAMQSLAQRACNLGSVFVFEGIRAQIERRQLAPPVA